MNINFVNIAGDVRETVNDYLAENEITTIEHVKTIESYPPIFELKVTRKNGKTEILSLRGKKFDGKSKIKFINFNDYSRKIIDNYLSTKPSSYINEIYSINHVQTSETYPPIFELKINNKNGTTESLSLRGYVDYSSEASMYY